MKYMMLMRHGEHEAVEACCKLTNASFKRLEDEGIPDNVLESLTSLGDKEFTKDELLDAVEKQIGEEQEEQTEKYKELILKHVAQRKLTKEGKKQTKAVAERLASVLGELDGENKISIGAIWRAHTDEVFETSELVIEALDELVQCTPERVEDLEPATFKTYENAGKHDSLVNEKLKNDLKTLTDSSAVLIIGHQPLLGWIAHKLLGEAVPIVRSELFCIALDVGLFKRLYGYLRWVLSIGLLKRSYGHLLWVLSPSNDAAMEEIKGKIRSKMEIAKLLSVFITTALGFLLSSLIDPHKMKDLVELQRYALYISAGLFFTAAALYLATMYAYDRLLMPKRFWGEGAPQDPGKRPKWLVWRPPSSAVWVLYQNMMRIWRYLFTGATCAVLLGLFSLTYAVFKPTQPSVFIGIVALGLLLFWLYYRHFGPKLGSED